MPCFRVVCGSMRRGRLALACCSRHTYVRAPPREALCHTPAKTRGRREAPATPARRCGTRRRRCAAAMLQPRRRMLMTPLPRAALCVFALRYAQGLPLALPWADTSSPFRQKKEAAGKCSHAGDCIRHSSFVIDSSFGIRHSSLPGPTPPSEYA